MSGRRFLSLFLLIILLALATSPLLAQDALTQTETAVDADGTILTVSYPAGWQSLTGNQGILLATSASALDELNRTGLVTSAGDVGMIVSLPNFMDNLSLPHDAPAEQAVSTYLAAAQMTGAKVETSTDFGVPAATVIVTPTGQTTLQAMIGALQFPGGTSIVGVIPASALDTTTMAILNSITLEAPADILPVTPDTSVSLKTASFDYLDIKGAVTLSLGLPDGWVTQYSDHGGILYVGNTDAALKKASAPGVTFEPGEIALTIALPHAVVGLGIPPDSTPAAAISSFQTSTQAQGRVVSDDSFSVPAAHAHLTGGNLPDGGGDVYAMKFDQGLVFMVVQPSGIIDGTVMAIIQSIQLGQTGTPQPTAVATQATTADTGDATTVTITQPNGAFDLSYDLPDGWVSKPSSSGTSFNLGSSAAVADKVANGQEALAAGEVGLTMGVPQLLSQMGVTFDATPEEAVSNFIKITNSKGTVEQDTSFSIPAAHASITGDAIPGGGAELYALAFDGGTLLIAVQPQGATGGDVLDLLKSIRFTPSTAAPATAQPEATALPEATVTPATSAKPIRQWATSADASSQYGNDDWSASQATGKPNTTTCEDAGTAWASANSTERAILRVQFDQPVIASQINIYQSFNPGAIVEVDLGSASDTTKVLPLPNSADSAGNTACPGVFSVDVSGVDAPVSSVVIYIDQSLTGDWNEIDAVELVGTPAS